MMRPCNSGFIFLGLFAGIFFASIGVAAERESITLITEPDSPRERQFFRLAEIYFQHDPKERTEYVAPRMRTLKDVRDYLEKHPPSNRLPWGVVNVVVHSNEWTGIGVSVAGWRQGERTTPESLRQALGAGRFIPLPNKIVDSGTEIRIHGCGLGKNRDLLEWISRAFGGIHDIERPQVRSDRDFIVFTEEHRSSGIPRVAKFHAKTWYAFYPPGRPPPAKELIEQLHQRYPEEKIDWASALKRRTPLRPGDTYHERFAIPLTWIECYAAATSMPKIEGVSGKAAWIKTRRQLQAHLARMEIPFDPFDWRLEKTTHILEDGKAEPAIKLQGRVMVVCVLQLFTS